MLHNAGWAKNWNIFGAENLATVST